MDSQRHRIQVLGILHRLHERPLRSAEVKGLSQDIRNLKNQKSHGLTS